MGTTVKISLIVVWALSIIGLAILGIRQATEQAFDGNVIVEKSLPINTEDTLRIVMHSDNQYGYDMRRSGGLEIKYNANKNRVIYSNDIRFMVKSSKDSVGKIMIEKKAEGNNSLDAQERAEAIEYQYSLENSTLNLDAFFITDPENKYRDQKIEITIYLPEGTVIYADENTSSYYESSNYDNWFDWNNDAHYLKVLKNKTECLDCQEIEKEKNTSDSTQVIKSIDTINKEKSRNWEEELNDNLSNDSN